MSKTKYRIFSFCSSKFLFPSSNFVVVYLASLGFPVPSCSSYHSISCSFLLFLPVLHEDWPAEKCLHSVLNVKNEGHLQYIALGGSFTWEPCWGCLWTLFVKQGIFLSPALLNNKYFHWKKGTFKRAINKRNLFVCPQIWTTASLTCTRKKTVCKYVTSKHFSSESNYFCTIIPILFHFDFNPILKAFCNFALLTCFWSALHPLKKKENSKVGKN